MLSATGSSNRSTSAVRWKLGAGAQNPAPGPVPSRVPLTDLGEWAPHSVGTGPLLEVPLRHRLETRLLDVFAAPREKCEDPLAESRDLYGGPREWGIRTSDFTMPTRPPGTVGTGIQDARCPAICSAGLVEVVGREPCVRLPPSREVDEVGLAETLPFRVSAQ